MFSICRFATASADITPPVGLYHRMWGAARHDVSTGVHRPLKATVLLFEPLHGARNATERQIIVALDHCLLESAQTQAIANAIEQACGWPADCVAVVFSHTHAAGLMSLDRVTMPGGDRIPAYLDLLTTTVAQAAQDAAKQLRPVTITYGQGVCSLAVNRDQWDDETGQWVCGYNPRGIADDTLMVARITAQDDGQLLLTVVNYACHPTTLAWENTLISPDYPGALCERVEQATGAPCVFLQGASGDLGPREGFVGDVAVADRNGRQVGHAALAVLESLPPPATTFVYQGPVISGATIGKWHHVEVEASQREAAAEWQADQHALPIAYRDDLPRIEEVLVERAQLRTAEQQAEAHGDLASAADCRALVERKTRQLARLQLLPPGPHYPYQIRLLRIGDAVWVAVQGEPYQDLQRELRRHFPGVPILVMTITGGWGPSYLPPAACYGKGIYQEQIAVLKPGCLEAIIDDLILHVRKLFEKK
jgi:hypothetical protein